MTPTGQNQFNGVVNTFNPGYLDTDWLLTRPDVRAEIIPEYNEQYLTVLFSTLFGDTAVQTVNKRFYHFTRGSQFSALQVASVSVSGSASQKVVTVASDGVEGAAGRYVPSFGVGDIVSIFNGHAEARIIALSCPVDDNTAHTYTLKIVNGGTFDLSTLTPGSWIQPKSNAFAVGSPQPTHGRVTTEKAWEGNLQIFKTQTPIINGTDDITVFAVKLTENDTKPMNKAVAQARFNHEVYRSMQAMRGHGGTYTDSVGNEGTYMGIERSARTYGNTSTLDRGTFDIEDFYSISKYNKKKQGGSELMFRMNSDLYDDAARSIRAEFKTGNGIVYSAFPGGQEQCVNLGFDSIIVSGTTIHMSVGAEMDHPAFGALEGGGITPFHSYTGLVMPLSKSKAMDYERGFPTMIEKPVVRFRYGVASPMAGGSRRTQTRSSTPDNNGNMADRYSYGMQSEEGMELSNPQLLQMFAPRAS